MKAPSLRFSSTVNGANVPRPSGTWATPSLTICSVARLLTSLPRIVTLPCGLTIPQIARRVVVLPAPLAPSSATVWPSSTLKETSSSTFTGP